MVKLGYTADAEPARLVERLGELDATADDADALQLALAPRITGTAAARTSMGIGLKLLLDFSDLLDAELWLVSGAAALHRRTAAGVRTNSIRVIGAWRGTWISLDATLPRRLAPE